MDLSPEAAEPVIGDRQEQSPAVRSLDRLAQAGVHLLVHIVDHMTVGLGLVCVVRGMAGVSRRPEGMLNAVRVIEHEGEYSLVELLQLGPEHLPSLGPDRLDLGQELVESVPPMAQRVNHFRHSERMKGSNPLAQGSCVVGRTGDVERRARRVQMDGAGQQLEVGRGLQKDEADHAVDAGQAGLECDP